MFTKGYSIKYNTETSLNAVNDMTTFTHAIKEYAPKETKIPFKGNSLALYDDDSKFIFCSVEGRVAACDRNKNDEIIYDVQLPGGGLYALTLFKDEKHFLTGGKEGVIRQYTLGNKEFKFVRDFRGHTNKISEIILSKDETQLYSCSDDSTVKIWNMETGQPEDIYTHGDRALTMDLSIDGRYLATGSADKTTKIYDLQERKIIGTIEGAKNTIWYVKFNKKCTKVASGDNDGVGYIHEFGTWNILHTLKGHDKRVSCIELINNDRRCVTASNDTTLRVWDLVNNSNPIIWKWHLNWVKAMLISSDELNVFSISEDHRIITWRVPEFDENSIRLTNGHTKDIYNIIYSQKRGLFFTNANDNLAIAWDFNTKKKVHEFTHKDGVYAKCLTHDENYLITCTAANEVIYWDLDSYTQSSPEEPNEATIKAILATKDGKYLITGDTICRVTIKSIGNSGKNTTLAVFRKHKATIWSLAVNSTSTLLFSGDETGLIYEINLIDGNEICSFKGHTGKVKCLEVSKNDSFLVSGSWDKTFKVWSIIKRSLIKSVTVDDTVNTIYFTNDNNYFMMAQKNQFVSIWSLRNFTLVTEIKYDKDCTALALTSDEQYMITAEQENIYITKNPLSSSSFWIYGNRDIYEFLIYLKYIIIGEPKPYKPEMNKYLIAPVMMNIVHVYSYFNLTSHLKKALQDDAPFFSSKKNVSPLSLCLSKDYPDAASIIINWVISNLKTNIYAAKCIEDSLTTLNFKGYPIISELYENFWVNTKDHTLPKFCPKSIKFPITISSRSIEPFSENFFKENVSANEGKSVKYFISTVCVNMAPGSKESIAFLRSIWKCSNEEIFRTKYVKNLLHYKWNQLWWIKVIEASIYAIYMGYLIAYAINFPGYGAEAVPLFIINLVLVGIVIYRVLTGGTVVLESGWDLIDLLRFACLIIYVLFIWFDCWQSNNNYLFTLLIFLSFIRGISYFRIFEETRYLIHLIQEVSFDIGSFLVLLLYSTLSFGVIFYTIQNNSDLHIKDYLTMAYRIDLNDFDTKGFNSFEWVIFGCATLVNSIIMLNLLISIMGDTYERVNDGMIVADGKELANLIIDCELLLIWKRNKTVKKYLQGCREEGDKVDETWGGSTREIKDKVTVMKKIIDEGDRAAIEKIKKLNDEIKKVTDEKLKDDETNLGKIIEIIDKGSSKVEEMDENITKLAAKIEKLLKKNNTK
ncbi:unnamed protein product [Blepharisma stoltei]|uniref:Ion transport domain-containing protein n=1 Tax=Blepharisma stoltei TaxID=1481888 RepID=A0AAU9K0R4_9CILI|nr:unnamed protein product [Blepharisma stoltei]